jgi:hypothetical protein
VLRPGTSKGKCLNNNKLQYYAQRSVIADRDCQKYSAERVEYSVHALPRVVTRDAHDIPSRSLACAQRGCAAACVIGWLSVAHAAHYPNAHMPAVVKYYHSCHALPRG